MTAEALLIDADVAMYQAKQTGRNRLEVAGGDERGDGHHQWSKRVQEALSNDRLELWEQPLMNLATGECDRSELLVRMRGRHGEVIPAAHFVPVVERFGQIQAIDSWVVSRALALVAHRQSAGVDAGIEINLSARSVTDERVMDSICTQVAAATLDPTRITFEVTETAAIGDVDRARRLMGRLARLGCRFALDDFGAGFASLRHLKHLPFDVVKIDGEFIGRLPDSRFDQIAVRGLVEIAHGSGKLVIAERVADDATLDLLRAFGVDYAQGFHIARPRPTDSASGLELAA
jgi:EAL domain-containing protein (putative c-di-GMP-specific phosphodiesterase class I)